MTVTEYQSWLVFYREEPWGDVRADLRSGIVAALIARTMGGKKNARPIDFMPVVDARRKDEERAMSQSQRNAISRQIFEGNLGPMRVRRTKVKRGKGSHGFRFAR